MYVDNLFTHVFEVFLFGRTIEVNQDFLLSPWTCNMIVYGQFVDTFEVVQFRGEVLRTIKIFYQVYGLQ